MTVTYEPKSLTEEEIAQLTPEKCWEKVEALKNLLTTPGDLQYELRFNSPKGEEFVAKQKELLHLLVDNFEMAIGPSEDSEVVDKMAELMRDMGVIQLEHLMGLISQASMHMQLIPPAEMILEFTKDHEEALDQMSAEGKAAYEATRSEIEEAGAQAAGVKLHPTIGALFMTGVYLAGGHAEFAKIQFEVSKNLPDEFRDNASLMLTSQLLGGIMRALEARASSFEMMNNQARALIESVRLSKNLTSMQTVALWHLTPNEVVKAAAESFEAAVDRNVAKVEEAIKGESSVPDVAVGKNSTVFAGNSTVN